MNGFPTILAGAVLVGAIIAAGWLVGRWWMKNFIPDADDLPDDLRSEARDGVTLADLERVRRNGGDAK